MNLKMALATTYVVEDWKFNETAGNCSLTARKSGFFAWLSAKLLGRTSMTFDVNLRKIVFNDGWRHVIPVKHVSNIGCGYRQNGLWLVLGLLVLCAALNNIFQDGIMIGLLCLSVSGLFIYLYFMSRKFIVSVTATSGEGVAFCVKCGSGAKFADCDASKIIDMITTMSAGK